MIQNEKQEKRSKCKKEKGKRNARKETVSNRYPVSVRNIKVDIS